MAELLVDGGAAQAAYEKLRGCAVAGVPAGGLGLIILLRAGLAAWVAEPAIGADASAAPRQRRAEGTHVSGAADAGLVRVLASMVLGSYAQKEAHV